MKRRLEDTRSKGVQMSHRWIADSMLTENLTSAGAAVARQVGAYRKRYAAGSPVTPPYGRWIVMVTGRQKHLHEKTQGHQHLIQSPLITLPDDILLE